ncbi:hypothetical protein U1872_07185 [Sphingomonas sp. RB3P16]|uniref:hypothetical protein n=1 Tax=Parasphingomonas frigoris TaxID=3096163 RepID=UPI002FCC1648
MAGSSPSQRLILPLAPLVAGIIGVLTAAMFALVPIDLLESMVVDSGIAAVLPAAAPPLGLTARAALVLLCGGGIALVAWFGLFLLFGSRTIVLQRARKGDDEAPVLRRADAHPDAPSRRPLFANTDLGTPFLEVRAPAHRRETPAAETPPVALTPFDDAPERALPADLDQPLSAYDPAAVRAAAVAAPEADAPVEPVGPRPLPRRQTFDEAERFETFPLPLPGAAAERATAQPMPIRVEQPRADPSDTINALLDRLERVVARRDPAAQIAPPPATSAAALTDLPHLVPRAG